MIVGPTDLNAVGHYRLIWPAETLAVQGADVTVDTIGPRVLWSEDWSGHASPPPHVRALGVVAPDCDVYVIQRPTRRWWADIIPHLQSQGVRVVVDMDDRLDSIHRRHHARHLFDPVNDPNVNHRWADVACKTADLVTCSTPALRDRYGYGHGVVVPNLVPARLLDVVAANRAGTVGWSGFVATHPGDLDTIAHTIPASSTFHVVGPVDGVAAALRLPGDRVTSTGRVDFDEYPSALAELEVGVVPLADTPFNRCKSALKMMEMAAVGVPAVVAATPDNLRMNAEGVGCVAASPGAWRRHLRRLTASPDARADLAGRSREAMTRFTYEGHADRWWQAWQSSTSTRSAA